MRVRKAYPENPCTSVLGSVNFLDRMEVKEESEMDEEKAEEIPF